MVITGSGIGPSALATSVVANGLISFSAGGTRVLFDGITAPMIYASSGQTSAIVPYAVAGRTTTQMIVEVNGVRSLPLSLDVLPAKPGLFAANSSGRGPGAILNQDNQLNAPVNPASKGSILILYGTGEGQTDPPGVDGQLALSVFPKPRLQHAVTIGGLAAEVLYFGAAPGIVADMFQANVRVPESAPSGEAPVILSVGRTLQPKQFDGFRSLTNPEGRGIDFNLGLIMGFIKDLIQTRNSRYIPWACLVIDF